MAGPKTDSLAGKWRVERTTRRGEEARALRGRGEGGCGTGGSESGGLTGEAGAMGSQVVGLAATADGGDVGGHEVTSCEGPCEADRRRDEGGEGEVERVDGGGKGIGRGGEGRATKEGTKVMAVGVRVMRVAVAMMTAKGERGSGEALPFSPF